MVGVRSADTRRYTYLPGFAFRPLAPKTVSPIELKTNNADGWRLRDPGKMVRPAFYSLALRLTIYGLFILCQLPNPLSLTPSPFPRCPAPKHMQNACTVTTEYGALSSGTKCVLRTTYCVQHAGWATSVLDEVEVEVESAGVDWVRRHYYYLQHTFIYIFTQTPSISFSHIAHPSHALHCCSPFFKFASVSLWQLVAGSFRHAALFTRFLSVPRPHLLRCVRSCCGFASSPSNKLRSASTIRKLDNRNSVVRISLHVSNATGRCAGCTVGEPGYRVVFNWNIMDAIDIVLATVIYKVDPNNVTSIITRYNNATSDPNLRTTIDAAG
jgi:hypothetical protein